MKYDKKSYNKIINTFKYIFYLHFFQSDTFFYLIKEKLTPLRHQIINLEKRSYDRNVECVQS